MIKWLKRIGMTLVGLLLVALAIIYIGSEVAIRKDWSIPLAQLAAASSPAAVAEGERLARINGCLSCHGSRGQGGVLVDNAAIGTIVAPPLAQVAGRDSDAELARSIRQGVNKAGRQMWIMPAHLTLADEDTARIMGFIRTLKTGGKDVAAHRAFGPVGRLGIVIGLLPASPHTPLTAQAQRPADVGSYFAHSPCLNCHDPFKANSIDGEQVPPLAIAVRGYDDASFLNLLRMGKSAQGADLGLMSEAAQRGFRYLTDEEITAIKSYLDGLGKPAS